MYHLMHREINGKVSGSFLGVGWLILQPFLLLSMYTLVFGVFMKSRWGDQSEGVTYFAIALFPGLLVFNLFADCLNRAPLLVVNNPNYVKKVVFPLELLVVPVIGGALIQFFLGYVLCVSLVGFTQNNLPLEAILVPIFLIPFVLMIAGFSWALSSVGLYFRDLGSLVPLIIQVLMFLSPVLYPISNVPVKIRPLLYLNPLTFMVDAVRGCVLNGEVPSFTAYISYLIVSILIAYLGFIIFNSLRPGFSDVV